MWKNFHQNQAKLLRFKKWQKESKKIPSGILVLIILFCYFKSRFLFQMFFFQGSFGHWRSDLCRKASTTNSFIWRHFYSSEYKTWLLFEFNSLCFSLFDNYNMKLNKKKKEWRGKNPRAVECGEHVVVEYGVGKWNCVRCYHLHGLWDEKRDEHKQTSK